MTFKTLADPVFAPIFKTEVIPYDGDAVRQALINHGEKLMNDQIICETTEEHSHAPQPFTTLINPSSQMGQPVPIVGVSGNTYAPMDTSPQAQASPEQDQNARVKMLMDMLTTTLNQLVKELQAPSQPQTDLEEAVTVALEQADWFRHRVEDATSEHIDNMDLDYEIGQNVERYMRNFDPNDHVDFNDLVNDRVDDLIDDIVSEKVEEAVEARLADLLEEKLQNANISISF
jgi:hypothetical protein